VVHPFWGTLLKHLRSAKHQAMTAVLAAARHAAGLTQRQLAAKLKRSNSFVWKLEAGERQLNVLEFIEIAQILGITPSVLLAQFELTPEHVESTHVQEVDPGKLNTT
jgi:transcriptional regulator with XRE-family HTH domain